MRLLAIETSCDETAAAVLDNGTLLSNIVYSQLKLHQPFGGVVPEIASRAHLQTVIPTIQKALVEAGIQKDGVEAIAVTFGPGLVGSLLVGLNVAKAMAYALNIPLIGVNHLEGHIFANRLDHPDLEPPAMVLLVSGGHTILLLLEDWGRYRVLGQTIDDAAGEAFDKVAKMLTLGYPGGPIIDKLAREGNPEFYRFPRAWLDDKSYNFSFSGLKTAVLNYLKSQKKEFIREHLTDICASFQAAVTDVLLEKTVRAAKEFEVSKIALTGGVARNSYIRAQFEKRANQEGLQLFVPSPAYCTDNAAMIGAAGQFYLEAGQHADFSLDAVPNLGLNTRPA